MTQIYTFYQNHYVKTDMDEEDNWSMKVGNSESCDVVIKSVSITDPINLVKEENGLSVNVQKEGEIKRQTLQEEPLEVVSDSTFVFVKVEEEERSKTYYTGGRHEWTVGSSSEAMIRKKNRDFFDDEQSDISFINLNGGWILHPGTNKHVYLNGKRAEGSTAVSPGDIVFLPFMTLTFHDAEMLEVRSPDTFESLLTETAMPLPELKKLYPDYRRTPRMIYDLPRDKVSLSLPAQEGDDQGRSLWLIILPPLVMLIVMGIVALVIPRGIFIIISIMMFTTTLITSTIQYFRERRRQKDREEKRQRVYQKYLIQKRQELHKLREKQKEVMYFHFPAFEKMKYLTTHFSTRIWERTHESNDFLELRIGRADVPSSYEIASGAGDFSNRDTDDLVEKFQELKKVYNTVKDLPFPVKLTDPIGLVGKRSILLKELHQLIGQLSFFHSYHDLRIITIFDEQEYDKWSWVKWLPHVQIPKSYAKALIYNEKTRDQLLPSLYSMIRERDLTEDKNKKRFMPHLVFIVANQHLISDHVIMEYIDKNSKDLGVSVVFATEAKESLSNHIHTLVHYLSAQEGELLIEGGKAVHRAFTLDHHTDEGNENFARMLYSLNHLTGIHNSIPDMVTFLDLFECGADELPIQQNWSTNLSSKSLAVPIGLKGKEDIVELNLHEKAHGPHGLIAGTTGSGKSELLQTYVLSLAVHYHPHDVAFLLIDYKGGGMAQPFEGIPHLLGTITNIHGSKNFSTRALASINSELKRRQTLFDKYKVNHIHDYSRLYKEGIADDPMPHLFLISDEFAELKNEEPDFIRELVSIARIGRSLGVHLILATQKPGGIIDDQIWSNSKFRIALKVQDSTDSKEILKNHDAAELKTTGRGYLQVGNNEVYELFQSAWSGASFQRDTFEGEEEVSLITDLGLIQISDVETRNDKETEKTYTEMEITVRQIIKTQEEMNLKRLDSPWLPPLSDRLFKTAYPSSAEREFPFALKDEPELQRQEPYVYQFIKEGNIGIFGSSGFGKSTTALSLLLHFVESFSPEEVHYYIFDFGNGALLPLKQLPHTADYFRYDEQKKIGKFMNLIKGEINRRKRLFLDAEVSTITLYNQVAEKQLPVIMITIDNFDLVKEELNELENQFIQFARDGQSLGIFLLFTATRINTIRQPLMNSLKTKVVHYLMDDSEMFSVLGHSRYEIEPIPGRALIKKEEAYLSQVFLPAEGEDDFAILQGVKRIVEKTASMYEGYSIPEPIPMLPQELNYQTFVTEYMVTKGRPGHVAVGLDEETVKPVHVDMTSHCLVTGQSGNGKTNVMKVMIRQLLDQPFEAMAVIDGTDRKLSFLSRTGRLSYVETQEDMNMWLNRVEEILMRRDKALATNPDVKEKEHANSGIYLVIDSLTRLHRMIDNGTQGRIVTLIKQYNHLGFRIVCAGDITDFTKGFDPLTNELKQIRQAVLLMRKSDQNLFTLPFLRNEDPIQQGFGYYVWNGKEQKIQIPHDSGVNVREMPY